MSDDLGTLVKKIPKEFSTDVKRLIRDFIPEDEADLENLNYVFFDHDGADRAAMYPVKYPDHVTFADKLNGFHWLATEISFVTDKERFEHIPDEAVKKGLKATFLFFSATDNILERLVGEVATGIQEIIQFNHIKASNEREHAETYKAAILAIWKDETDLDKVFHALERTPFIRAKQQMLEKYAIHAKSYFNRLLGMFLCESIFFLVSFGIVSNACMMYADYIPGLKLSLGFIQRDENIHAEQLLAYMAMLPRKPDLEQSERIFKEFSDQEIEFANVACEDDPMLVKIMRDHVRALTNHWFELFCHIVYGMNKTTIKLLYPVGEDGKHVPEPHTSTESNRTMDTVSFFEVDGTYSVREKQEHRPAAV